MKKIYVMPLTATTTVELEQMMAGSNLLQSKGDGSLQQDFSEPQTTTETSGNLGRRNVWDDEEEEEEVR